jgi:quinol monooxygenase YgiN
VADFDRLAEQAAEEVRTREPDTLVYVIHLVPNAPMQRIFYEIYRDRVAFDSHENQPYMKRFVADRRACVLATNVIELRLKYAKVAPLPGPQPPSPRPPAPPAPGPPAPGPLAPGPLAPGQPYPARRPQSLEPLPPRPDRRMPSGDPRYGGI